MGTVVEEGRGKCCRRAVLVFEVLRTIILETIEMAWLLQVLAASAEY